MSAVIGFIGLFVWIAFSSSAHAQTSAEYVKMGQRIWPAFECAVAAGRAGNPEAQERLFKLGYDYGRAFIAALSEGKIDRSDIRSSIAIGTTLRLQGPSADFMLGRIWEGVVDEYYRKATDKCPECGTDADLMKMNAENRYREMNCTFLE